MPENREISAKTSLGEKLLFSRMTGFDEISRCFRYDLELVSEDVDIDAA